MLRLQELITSNEDWLIDKVIEYFKACGYVKFTSTLKEAWRISIAGMSDTILKALKNFDHPPVLGPELNYENDPIAGFGILEARKHRARGVDLGMFLGGMKCYRQGYTDLVRKAGFAREEEERCRRFVNRVFDRVEIAFCMEWNDTIPNDLVKVLQTSNRNITNEKNKYLTIYESLPNPVIIYDRNNQIESMNHAAMTLFGGTGVPGRSYYNKQDIIDLSWLTEALAGFTANNYGQNSLEEQVVIKEKTYFLELNFNTLLDVSGKYNGNVVVINDITEIRQAEEEQRNHFKQQKIISDISTKLINLPPNEVNKAINDALMEIGRFAGADRSYIFIFSDDQKTIDNTHEWCNQGVTPQIENLKGLHVSNFPWLMKKLARFEVVNIPVVADLPPQAHLEKESFQVQDIKSLTLVPLNYADKLAGLVGFDSVFKERTWPEETIAPLKIIGEMLINVIQRGKLEQEMRSAYKHLDQILTTAGDAMWVIDVNFNVMRVNDAFCALTGVSKEKSAGKKCYDLFYDRHCNTQDCPLFRITGGEERVEYDVLKECNGVLKFPVF